MTKILAIIYIIYKIENSVKQLAYLHALFSHIFVKNKQKTLTKKLGTIFDRGATRIVALFCNHSFALTGTSVNDYFCIFAVSTREWVV